MRMFEHEGKEILQQYRIPIPEGVLVSAPESVAIDRPSVIKAQVPIGGRGKAGGILTADTTAEARTAAGRLLGSAIRGFRVQRVLAEPRADIAREFFLAVTYDTAAKMPLAIFSRDGGIDVQTVRDPERIQRVHFTVGEGLPEFRAREMAAATGLGGKTLLAVSAVLSRLADLFLDCDATLAEINPLACCTDGRVLALDCHLEIDDDALFRHPRFQQALRDHPQRRQARRQIDFEREAARIDALDHRGVAGRVIAFDGDLGLIIGGGGASLTAFDAVLACGGQPANYCEVGGNPSVRKVAALTRLILSRPGVDHIAVITNVVSNTRVDLMARGIVKGILAAGKRPAETVRVFRVPGAWEDEGERILRKYGIRFADRTVSIDEAARMAVQTTAPEEQTAP